jgi:predicted AlkP superfamily phosphohydrolase/phosphomutase
VLLILVIGGCLGRNALVRPKRVLILGVDGLDPKLLQEFMDAGELPNFRRFIGQGDFKHLTTTMPPLSPVAWATFITGMDPGGHGIFDFVHREPTTLQPQSSISRALPPKWQLTLGDWVFPLSQGRIQQQRHGTAFWQILEEHGIPTQIVRMPVNFPPATSPGKSLSGMGTPDILGTPGIFSFYTTNPPGNADELSGGRVFPVQIKDHRVSAQLLGPQNPFRRQPESTDSLPESKRPRPLEIDFEVFLDPNHPVAKFVVQGNEFILKVGEWSDWIPLGFSALPYLGTINAIGRFYLQEVTPTFRLYVTPLQIDPAAPVMPISTPTSWSKQLSQRLGYFYTQELPEETQAFSAGIFTAKEFWEQAQLVWKEQREALDYFLQRFDGGLLFFYFSTLDQGAHMLWRYHDPKHPGSIDDAELRTGLMRLYQGIDDALRQVMRSIDDRTTVIIMSDHGFAPFYWGVNVNSWLLEKGYVKLKDPDSQDKHRLYQNVDWSNTTAYALGLNGVYVNLLGREKYGIVYPGKEHETLLDRLEADLLAMRDSQHGRRPVTLVTRPRRDFQGPQRASGPDLIVGYNWGYRSSWQSPLGEFPKDIFVENHDAWSGDHSIDYRLVPGVLITNQRINLDKPALYDLTVAVLDEFNVKKLSEMIGQDCLIPRTQP